MEKAQSPDMEGERMTRIDTSDTYKKQDKQLLKEMPRNRFTDWLFGLIMDINHEERKK